MSNCEAGELSLTLFSIASNRLGPPAGLALGTPEETPVPQGAERVNNRLDPAHVHERVHAEGTPSSANMPSEVQYGVNSLM